MQNLTDLNSNEQRAIEGGAIVKGDLDDRPVWGDNDRPSMGDHEIRQGSFGGAL